MERLQRVRARVSALDREKFGRAVLAYSGVPLAVFMTAGILATVLPRYGLNLGVPDPMQHLQWFYVLNVWLVIGIFAYRRRYRERLLYTTRWEMGLAGAAAFLWLGVQPLLLVAGYAAFMHAVWTKDSLDSLLHSKLLPDLSTSEDAVEGSVATTTVAESTDMTLKDIE